MIGSIYKIIHLDSNITYIGSTTGTVNDRWYQHKRGFKRWSSDKEKYNSVAIYPYFEKYSIDRFKMIQIKSYEIVDKTHLRVYEQLAMNLNKCCNINSAMQLIGHNCMRKHYNIINSEQNKQYREANRDNISEQQKVYKAKNREKISEYKKSYREQNRQKINEQKKIKIQCECGSQVSKNGFAKHKKTQKHLTALAALTN